MMTCGSSKHVGSNPDFQQMKIMTLIRTITTFYINMLRMNVRQTMLSSADIYHLEKYSGSI